MRTANGYLPPANEVARRKVPQVGGTSPYRDPCLCQGTSWPCPQSYLNLFRLDLIVQPPPHMFKLVHCEARTVSKRTVGILLEYFIITRPQRRSCGNVMFSQVSCVSAWGGEVYTPAPDKQTPPGQTAPRQTPPWANTPSSKWLLQRTVYILLECILVTAFNEVGAR